MAPNKEILLRNINSQAKNHTIELIRNGSTSKFRSIKLKSKNVFLSNTCAFDSIVQILAGGYCDSTDYGTFVSDNKTINLLWNLIFTLLKDEVTVQTYRKRAIILRQFLKVIKCQITFYFYQLNSLLII